MWDYFERCRIRDIDKLTDLAPSPSLWVFGRSSGIFWKMSAHKHRTGVVIKSFSLVNSNQAAHSTPPPPTVKLSVRFGLSSLFLSEYAGSGAHRARDENPQVDCKATGVAVEGWVWRGWRRAYEEGGDNVSRGPRLVGDGARTPKTIWADILVRP